MPREVIGDRDAYQVQVRWAVDRDVQVGVVGCEGRSLVWLLFGSDDKALAKVGEWVRQNLDERTIADDEQRGRELLNFFDTFHAGTDGPGYQGIWSDLGRAECNRLIRVLRRARDQAYGRDE